ncbi:MAG: hypothetical protein EB161_06370 [Nitrosopumilaceae archaeon]|nr:hypothetical protein [Nitrosopumilaceae archaeon]
MLFWLDIYEFFTILYQKAALADTVIIFRANSIFLKAPTGLIFLAFECLTAFDTFFVQPYYNTSQIIANKAYFVSRFHCVNNTKNNPRIKLPMTLTIKTLT